MEPILRGTLHEHIASAAVTFEDTDEVVALATHPGSANHFFDRFVDEVQLRLDWSSLDANGQPTLDADFIDPGSGKHRRLQGNRREAHNTVSSPGEGRRYEWEFEGISRRFAVAVVWLASAAVNAHATVSCTAEVIRASDSPVEHA
jgi:hypothetical protein